MQRPPLDLGRSLRPLLSFVASACLLAAPAAATAAPFEPNDNLLQATGPLVGGQDYSATIENGNDTDFFYFNVVGQRQLDIALTATVKDCSLDIDMYTPDGESFSSYLSPALTSYSCELGKTGHIKFTTPSSGQYIVKVHGYSNSTYRLRVDPADAISQTDPGLVAHLRAGEEGDDIQRVYVDGVMVGETRGSVAQDFSLGNLMPTSQITFEAVNQADGWSWDASVTNTTGRAITTVFTEEQSGGSSWSSDTVTGAVRRVSFTPTGGILASCGVALAPVLCDVPPPPPPAPLPPTPVDPPYKYSRSVSIARKSGRYRGRVRSADSACYRSVTVELRRKGKGSKRYGTTTTRQDGSWTIRRKRALKGKVYAYVSSSATCKTGKSKALRKKR